MIGEAIPTSPPLTPDLLWPIEHYKEAGLYFYLEATQELLPNGHVDVINYGDRP